MGARSARADNHVAEVAACIKRRAWQALADRLGYDIAGAMPIPAAARSVWGLAEVDLKGSELRLLSVAPAFRLLLLRGEVSRREFRRAVLAVAQRNAEDVALWWWERGGTAVAATASHDPRGGWRMKTIELSIRAPEAAALAAWMKLDRRALILDGEIDAGRAHRRHLGLAFEHRELTRAFFEQFSDALQTLVDTLERGPDDPALRHEVALAAMLRVTFVYFLQRRGVLAGDATFMLRHFRRAVSQGGRFFQRVLRPLFFGALNCPLADRAHDAAALGELPFLNGGLFEPLPVEHDHPDLGWPDAVWGDILEGLFERYHFAVAEGAGEDTRAAVDPEMLGRVFEGLMYGDSRHKTGSFYTPRDVVRGMVEDALTAHLADAAEVPEALARAVVRDAHAPLPAAARRRLRSALETVKILDPAVGTGAFLLEALHALRRCWRALGGSAAHGARSPYEHVRNLIHEHLFGVDVQHTAVRLCELRLWLTLLVELPEGPAAALPALPNLAHRVCTGNSLLSPLDLVRHRAGLRRDEASGWAIGQARQVAADHLLEVRRLQADWLTAHGPQKRRLRSRLQRAMERTQRALLEARIARLRAQMRPLEALRGSTDLFGETVSLTDPQRRSLEKLRAEIAALADARGALDEDRASRLTFSYAAHFGGVLERGGFDIVVTNPPWVRAGRVDPAIRGALKSRYRAHDASLWAGARELGIRAPFGPQTDLAALFLERSLELLAPGGQLCALVPAKIFGSLHGAALRRLIADHDLLSLEDHSEANHELFDATTYPALIHLRKRSGEEPSRQGAFARTRERAPRRAPTRVTAWRGDHAETWQMAPEALPAVPGQAGSPWLLLEPPIADAIHALNARAVPLGSIEALRPRRGVFTGCNARFLVDEAQARSVVGDAWREWTRPVIRGRDSRAWRVRRERLIWWAYDAQLNPREDLPRKLREYFERHREQLQARSDHREAQPLWQVFRVKPGVDTPKVIWRDLSPGLEAAFARGGALPLNTVYFVPFASSARARIFEALLNSEPVRAVAYALAERARGGWRRHFAWVIRMLPVPPLLHDVFTGVAPVDAAVSAAALDVLGGADPRQKQRVADRLGARWFGLGAAELEALRTWRRAEAAAPTARRRRGAA